MYKEFVAWDLFKWTWNEWKWWWNLYSPHTAQIFPSLSIRYAWFIVFVYVDRWNTSSTCVCVCVYAKTHHGTVQHSMNRIDLACCVFCWLSIYLNSNRQHNGCCFVSSGYYPLFSTPILFVVCYASMHSVHLRI